MNLRNLLDSWKGKVASWLTVQGVIRAIHATDPKAVAREVDHLLDQRVGTEGSSQIETHAIPWLQAFLKELQHPTG